MATLTAAPTRAESDTFLSADIWVNPNRMHGTPCFAGTRVPVQTLFDHLRAGDGFNAFLDGYEGVTRDQVVGVIDLAARGLLNRVAAR